MTVRETLDFSGRCLGVGSNHEMLLEMSRMEREAGINPDPEIETFMKGTMSRDHGQSVATDHILKVFPFLSFVKFPFSLIIWE